jgi:SAM-dependent methyltransferase
MSKPAKRYDRAYFDHWYRGPEARQRRQYTARKAALAVAMAEYYLGRPLRSVLDIGCGEGDWRAPLLRLRPRLHYMGLDASEYAVGRHGKRRNLRLVEFAQLGELRFEQSFDLLVCSDVVHYLDAAELRRGLAGFAEIGHGAAFIDLFCRGDQAEGDEHGFKARPAAFYHRQFSAAGLLSVGSNAFLLPALHGHASAMERAAGTCTPASPVHTPRR